MKKFLYFLIGFLLTFMPTFYAYALECYDPYTGATNLNSYPAYTPNDITGVTTSAGVASTAGATFYTNFATVMPGCTKYSQGWAYYDATHTAGFYWVMYRNNTSLVYYCAYWPFSDGIAFSMDRCVDDTDGDGIPDKCDFYPNDTTDYKAAMIISAKNISTGVIVYEKYKTDRGDIFERGTEPLITDNTILSTLNIFPVLKPAVDFCQSGSSLVATQNAPVTIDELVKDTNIIGDSLVNKANTPTAPILPSTASIPSTGTETEIQAQQGILKNTNAINENLGDVTKYLSDINSKLTGLGTQTTINGWTTATGSGTGTSTTVTSSTLPTGASTSAGQATTNEKLTDIASKMPAQPTSGEVDTATTNAGTTTNAYDNATTGLNTGMSLENHAPLEFKTKTDIPAKMTEYLANNPISDILSNSGVNLTGATPYLSFPYKGQDIKLRVDLWDDALSAFGSILLAMVGLTGLVNLFQKD